jgi:hypothetical protein
MKPREDEHRNIMQNFVIENKILYKKLPEGMSIVNSLTVRTLLLKAFMQLPLSVWNFVIQFSLNQD